MLDTCIGADRQREFDVFTNMRTDFLADLTHAGFDPGTTPDPTEGDNLLRTSGRGLLLIRAFVDEVEFANPSDGGTLVTLTKRHASGSQSENDA